MEKLTKEELEGYEQLGKEISEIEDEIATMKVKRYHKDNYVGDTAKDYRDGFGKVILIQGYDTHREDKAIKELAEVLGDKREKLILKRSNIERKLDAVSDVEIRRIIRLKFNNKLTWDCVAARMETGTTGDACRMKLKRFLEENI